MIYRVKSSCVSHHITCSYVVPPKSIKVNFAEDAVGAIFAHTCSSEITFTSGSGFNDSEDSYDHFISIMNSVIDLDNPFGIEFNTV